MGSIWIRITCGIDRTGAYQTLLVADLVAKFLTDSIHYLHCLCDNFWAYAVSRKECNIYFHTRELVD